MPSTSRYPREVYKRSQGPKTMPRYADADEVDRLVQQKLNEMGKTGSGYFIGEGIHTCKFPDPSVGRYKPRGTVWRCVCKRKYVRNRWDFGGDSYQKENWSRKLVPGNTRLNLLEPFELWLLLFGVAMLFTLFGLPILFMLFG